MTLKYEEGGLELQRRGSIVVPSVNRPRVVNLLLKHCTLPRNLLTNTVQAFDTLDTLGFTALVLVLKMIYIGPDYICAFGVGVDGNSYSYCCNNPHLARKVSMGRCDAIAEYREVRELSGNDLYVDIEIRGVEPKMISRTWLQKIFRPHRGQADPKDLSRCFLGIRPLDDWPDWEPGDEESVARLEKYILKQGASSIQEGKYFKDKYHRRLWKRPSRLWTSGRHWRMKTPRSEPSFTREWTLKGFDGGKGIERHWDDAGGGGYTIIRTWSPGKGQ